MSKKYNELEIIKCYHEVMGSMISKRTREVKLRDRTLVLKMDSGVLKEELNHNKRQIIQMINDKMGAPLIEEVEVW
jgi:predicted nucleic acid-binding Zn ribbon protein